MAKHKISIEVEVETSDRMAALRIKDDMLSSLDDSRLNIKHYEILTDNITYIKQYQHVGPDAMTGAQIMTGSCIHNAAPFDRTTGPSGYKFQLIRRTVWTKLLNDMPTDDLREAFLSNVTAVWIHPDFPLYCWTQTRI